jgi:hypothetical protein
MAVQPKKYLKKTFGGKLVSQDAMAGEEIRDKENCNLSSY